MGTMAVLDVAGSREREIQRFFWDKLCLERVQAKGWDIRPSDGRAGKYGYVQVFFPQQVIQALGLRANYTRLAQSMDDAFSLIQQFEDTISLFKIRFPAVRKAFDE